MEVKSYKKSLEYSYSLGMFPTIELIKSRPENVIKVFVSSKYKTDSENDIFKICSMYNIKTEVNDKIINRISDKENNFAAGIFAKYECELHRDESHVVLVNPGNMGNAGTIIRTLTGFGLKNLAIISPGVDIFDPKVIRSSMGSLFRINFKYYDKFETYESLFNAHEKYAFMLDGEKSLKEINHDKNKCFSLIFGNEATGLDSYFSHVGKSVFIKHTDKIDSLNLTIAAGIALYHFFD